MSKRIAFLVATEGIEHDELTSPWGAVADAGHRPVLISTGSGDVQLFRHLDRSEKRPVDAVVDDVSIEDYNALVLPGGVANPDALRTNPAAVALVRDFVASGSPVAAICHAAWMLVEADVVVDRELASWPSRHRRQPDHQSQPRRPAGLQRGVARSDRTRCRPGRTGLIPELRAQPPPRSAVVARRHRLADGLHREHR